MSTEQTAFWKALAIGASREATPEFINIARQAKEDIMDAYYELARMVAILDNLVVQLAPEANWTPGAIGSSARDAYGRPIARPTAIIPYVTSPSRTDRILEISEWLMALEETTSVRSVAVAEELQKEGYEGTIRNLAVSVGNTLARAEGWEKVGPGEYAPNAYVE